MLSTVSGHHPLSLFLRRVGNIEQIHHKHCGITRMRAIDKSYVLWAVMDKQIEELARLLVKRRARI